LSIRKRSPISMQVQLKTMSQNSSKKTADKHNRSATLPEIDRSLPIALTRAREKVMLPIRQMLAASGITEQQWRILRVLYEQGPLDSTTLAEQACLLMPSLTRIAQSMVQKKLVTRVTCEDDRRRQTIAITVKGRAIIEDNLEEASTIANRFEQVLGKQQLENLLVALKQLEEL